MNSYHFDITKRYDSNLKKTVTKIEYWQYSVIGEKINVYIRYCYD